MKKALIFVLTYVHCGIEKIWRILSVPPCFFYCAALFYSIMNIHFSKMHGAGNDFIVTETPFSAASIPLWCDRRRGIGADGVIRLSPLGANRVRMDFFNSDGTRASMCGNGLRCAALYAKNHFDNMSCEMFFETDSGVLKTQIISDSSVKIELPVNEPFVKHGGDGKLLLFKGVTGVPHAVLPVSGLDGVDVESYGRAIRNHEIFAPDGVNVDFIEPDFSDMSQPVRIRTYERGVEGETLACGTGIGAAGCVCRTFFGFPENIRFLSRSGDILSLEIPEDYIILGKIYLTGPAEEVFRGITTAIRE